MQKFIPIFLLLMCCFTGQAFSQAEQAVYFKPAIKEKRELLKRNIIQHTIIKNLSLPLNEDTEENWMDAFGGMELIHYNSPWADTRINMSFDLIEKRTTYYQRALLELVFTNYPDRFVKEVTSLLNTTTDAKVFAMCYEYLSANKNVPLFFDKLVAKQQLAIKDEKEAAIIGQLYRRLKSTQKTARCVTGKDITTKDFLKNCRIVYSFQRKNRNYPGLAVVRDSAGNFIKDEAGNIFSVPQLARSINNLPGYLTNGNTPQGIFRMYGFDTSKSSFIGPTTNIQLTMPFETSLKHFFNDSTIADTSWTIDWYKKLLPVPLKNCAALFESYYAGQAGRTEIIAHGTTVDPEYYRNNSYYPQTPTMGCLCTKEIWSEEDGKRMESDQAKLAAAVLKAGGANGYCVVIEIDDEQKPVTPADVVTWLQ